MIMGLEEDLFGALKYAKLGGKMPTDEMVRQLIFNTQIGALRRLRDEIDKMISNVSKQGIGVKSTADLDPFKILGISLNATEEEVKKAYKKAAFKAHPDRGGSDQEMAKVNAAYEVIRRFKGWI